LILGIVSKKIKDILPFRRRLIDFKEFLENINTKEPKKGGTVLSTNNKNDDSLDLKEES
jgi:hypothetical protein